jgi:molecular chaperone HscA
LAKISINIAQGTLNKPDAPPAPDEQFIVGIDLGTTNSLVAYMQEGRPRCLTGPDGKNTLVPSVLHFADSGQVLVGDEARARLSEAPERTVFSVKRLMGKSYNDVREYAGFFSYKILDETDERLVKIRVGDRFYTPIELSAQILSELKSRAESALGRTVSRAVITVPAYFNDAQRQATRDAGKIAGLDVLRIVNEPTAASLAYGIGLDPEEHKTIAVYDLGGGTFDVSILRIENGIFEVLSTNGDTFLGGDDIDRAIVAHWASALGIADLSADPMLSAGLRHAAEEAKKQLSNGTTEKYSRTFPAGTCTLDLPALEQLAQPFVDRTLACCRAALEDAKLRSADLDEVVLVGGSTRMPLVKRAVGAFFGRPAHDEMNPDEVVALGAAIQADILAGNNKNFLLLDITPLSLGIETVGGLMDTIIPRNSKVPTAVGRNYTTSVDGQVNLRVAVFQGERELVADNRKLGEFVLRGIPPMPAGLPKIEIQFVLNADGILKVNAKELRSGVEQSVEMRAQYGISEEEMARMLLDSVQHAQADMQVRGLIEAQNEARYMLLAADKFLAQNDALLTEEEKSRTLALAQALRESLEGHSDKDRILRAIDELNTFTEPLAHRAMDVQVAEAMKGTRIEGQ